MVYLLNHPDNLIIYCITSRVVDIDNVLQMRQDIVSHLWTRPSKPIGLHAICLVIFQTYQCNTIHLRSSSWVVSMTFTFSLYNVGYCMQIDADVAKHCRPWPLGGWVHKLARMHKTIHTEVRRSWHVIVSIHRLARVHNTPSTPKAVECRTSRQRDYTCLTPR